MLRRSVKIQLVLFVVMTLVGISYVAAEYVGLARNVFANPCTIHADFPNGGGTFPNSEVTYRGVTIGRVGTMHLIKGGVRVDLKLDDCGSPDIPANTDAVVADQSVVGEQYVNLVPPNGDNASGPFLHQGATIDELHNAASVPTSTETLLVNLNDLVNSVPIQSLQTTVSELGKAFNGKGDDLRTLLDASSDLITTATEPTNIAATTALLNQAKTVLQTQLDLKDPIASWAKSLTQLTQQLKTSDPDIRHLLDTGPSDLSIINRFVTTNRGDLGVLLANLATVGNLLVRHLPGLEQVLELYPALAAGGTTVFSNDPNRAPYMYGRLSLVVQFVDDPPQCGNPKKGSEGYEGTTIRPPQDLSPIAPNVAAQCTASVASGTDIRGSAHVPGGDPVSISGGGIAYPSVVTQNQTAAPTPAASAAAKSVPAVRTGAVQGAAPVGSDGAMNLLTAALR